MTFSDPFLAIAEAASLSHDVYVFLKRVTSGSVDPVAKQISDILPAKSPSILALEELLAQTTDELFADKIRRVIASLGAQ